MKKRYNGVVVPMVTPFKEDGTIDRAAVARLVELQVRWNAHPFVLGTTGEAASVSRKERAVLVETTVKATASRRVVYAGISGNCFEEAVEEGQRFAGLGANVLVSTMPSYYPVDDRQMIQYFEKLADALPLPLVVYNIPATTHLSLPLEVVDELSHHSNIVGFKDSEKGEERVKRSIALWKDRSDFTYLLGWALMSQQAMLLGADGIVPSTGNLTPGLYQTIYEAGRAGNESLAMEAQLKADRISEIYQKDKILSRALPILKTMLAAYGLCGTDVLPPLLKVEAAEQEHVLNRMKELGDLDQLNRID